MAEVAGGTLGAGQVANASNDGYTLLLHHIGMSTAPTLYRNLGFDPLTDFTPVGLITSVPMTIVARKDFEPADFKGLRKLCGFLRKKLRATCFLRKSWHTI